MKRRDFLKYLGIGAGGLGAGFVLGKASNPPGAKLIPYLIPPEDVIPGVANWYAGVCTQCNAGCGTIVRVMEGRAKKIEGNPLHPVSRGKLCARGQASLQALYNPDRIKGPMRRISKGGDFTGISWEEGLEILSGNLAKLDKDAPGLYMLTPPLRGHLNSLVNGFMAAFGSPDYFQYELFQHRNLIAANRLSASLSEIPYYDIENTKFLLSFGADFSSTWLSPVNMSYGYGRMRQGGQGKRGRLVSVEPRMSLTGANADEWVPARPGTEGILALSMAYEIVSQGYYRGADGGAWKSVLARYRPAEAAKITDVGEERIKRIAREFAETRPSLAIGGECVASYENGVSGLVAVNVLNHVAGNMGIKGGVVPNSEGFVEGARRPDLKTDRISTLLKSASEGRVKALIVYNTNPLFTAPKALDAGGSLSKIPFIVSLSSFMDSTTAAADLILPSHTSLEDWGDDFAEPAVGTPVYTMNQPAVSPVFDTKGAGDILLAAARGAGGRVADRLKWNTFEAYLRESWQGLYKRNRAMASSAPTFDEFWSRTLQNGGWWQEAEEPRKRAVYVSASGAGPHLPQSPSRFEGDEKEYPFYLVLYPHAGHFDGRGANLPWLQETPDPMTSVVWGGWIEINPKTAGGLGVKEGDMVTVDSPSGRVQLPVYLYPGIRPDTVAMPIGQGHTEYGRYAKGRGSNPLDMVPAKEDGISGEIALNSTRVKITTSDMSGEMVKMEGSTKELGREIVQTVSPEEFEKMPKDAV
ncbi:MAG: molybdopterin-dependent oxidoreductase [Deltaproteobacteria bacterium]|nr:molybdopterin-dependent oxidoreductase [Deltaproteobacteria bacterium]